MQYDREAVIEYVTKQVEEVIQEMPVEERLPITDVINDCCIVSHGQGVGIIVYSFTIGKQPI